MSYLGEFVQLNIGDYYLTFSTFLLEQSLYLELKHLYPKVWCCCMLFNLFLQYATQVLLIFGR